MTTKNEINNRKRWFFGQFLSTLLLAALVSCFSVDSRAQQKNTASNRQSEQTIGRKYTVKMDNLPKPYQGEAVRNSPVIVPREARKPNLPAGFEATLFADGLNNPRQLLVLPNGDVLVVLQEPGYLMLMRDADGDGRAEWIERHASGFNKPHGLAYRTGEILIADQDGIWRLDYQDGLVRPPFAQPKKASNVPVAERKPSPFMDGQEMLSDKGVFGIVQGHANRDIEIAPDGRLFVGVGTSGNIGVEPEPKATIQMFSGAGKNQQTFSSGMRNPSGLAFQPGTGDLWAVVQERDGLGDRLVPDFLTKVEKDGFYGFPYSYIGQNPQPGFADRAPEKVKAAIVPDFLFEPHSAAMDFVFYAGKMFPAEYQGDAFVALKGSWNRSDPTGYKVVRVKFENNRPVGWYENFATGFWVDGEDKAEVWGRPADVAVAPDGALFIVDDTGGTIWRISYRK